MTEPSSLLAEKAYVDGTWIDADSGATFAVSNPATGETIADVPRCGVEETRRAIVAAERALPAWRARPAKERALVLRRLSDLMLAHQEELAVLLTSEQGKPLAEARGEIAYAASFFEWFGEEAKRVYGDTIPPHQADKRIVVLREPIGVTGYDREDARRNARFLGEPTDRERGERCLLGGLDDHRAADRERGRRLAGDHRRREVPGRDPGGDADRLA